MRYPCDRAALKKKKKVGDVLWSKQVSHLLIRTKALCGTHDAVLFTWFGFACIVVSVWVCVCTCELKQRYLFFHQNKSPAGRALI